MNSRTEELANKRRTLQLRCALQRQQLVYMTVSMEARLLGVDRILDIGSRVARNPIVIIAGIAGLVMLKPWRLLRHAGQAWLLFTLGRKLRGMMEKV